MRKTLPRVFAVIVVFLLLAWGAVYVIGNTDWGHERVRRRLVALIQGNSHGIVKIGGVSGDLLHGLTAHDLSITDSAAHPFIKVDSLTAAYGLRTLFGKKIDFSQVQLFRPVVVIDKQPGGRWNYDIIFPRDTVTRTGVKKTGWGTWIRFSDVTVVDGDLTVRAPWEMDKRVVGAERTDALRKATGPGGRLRIEKVANGYQKVSVFHKMNAKFPLLRLSDPAYRNSIIEVAQLSMLAEILRPPVTDVRKLSGNFNFTGDSVWWRGARLDMPATHAVGDGRYVMANSGLHLRLHADPISPNDLRWVEPVLPTSGTGKLDFALDWNGPTSTYTASNADIQLEKSHLAGKMTVVVNDSITFHDSDLRFRNLDTRLVTRIFPSVKMPRQGIASGHAAFDGGIRWLKINGDVAFYSAQSGRSHVIGGGQLGYSEKIFSAKNLKLRMLPMTMDLFEAIIAVPTPLGGTLSGTATLNGSTATTMTAQGDVTHVEGGAVSHATGSAGFKTHGTQFYNIDARVHPLALATAGKFMPSLGLHGYASGPVKLVGTLKDFRVNTDLNFSDGGYLNLAGTLDLAGRAKAYDLSMRSRLFNANAIIAKAPRTSISAVAQAKGRGTNLATMNATIAANISASSFDTVAIDKANVRVAIANGLARFDTLAVEVPQGILEARGSFGLVPGRSGTLTYHVAIDSLTRFAALVTPDTTPVRPRPGILARRIAKARADSLRIAAATEVERAVTGKKLPAFPVDTPAVVHKNELAGSVKADGTASGNIRNFNLKGTASGSDILARGNTVRAFTADYVWNNARTAQSQVSVNARALGVRAMGFDLDSVSGRLSYQKPNGTAQIVVNQDNNRTYTASAQYTLDKLRNTLQLNDLKLKFDTTTWSSTRVAALHWGEAGIDVQNLELRNGTNGRVYVNGRLPKTGSADLQLLVDNFDVQDIIAITQSDIDAKGLISLDVHATGTTDDPRFKGAFGATNLVYNGTTVPEVHGTVDYANQTLTGRALAMREGKQPFVLAEGTIPVNLALTGVTGSRFPSDRQIALNINADSLPLDLIPQISDIVANVKGDATGNFKLTGTLNHPTLAGNFALARGSAKIVPVGITVHDIYASIRMLSDTVVIDSIVGQSKGRIALYGGIGIGSLREPSFALRFDAANALVLNNDKGNLRADAQLAMNGPFKLAHVTGSVRIREGVVYIPPSDDKNIIGAGDPALFSVMDTAVMANKELFPAQSPLLANLMADVSLRVDRDVFVRSREANVEVYSDGDLEIHVNRAKEAFVLDGVLLSERGEYTFMTRRFNIKRGSATFINSAELNPTLQVTAEYEVRLPAREAINIQIVIGGTLNKPHISLQSDAQPPIAQSDLLSYLAFGRSSSSLVQLEGSGLTNGTSGPGNVVGAGASLASRQLAGVALGVFADQLAGEAARSLGADVFNITPADVQTDVGSFLKGTEIEFGKYINSHTFVATKTRLDPGSLNRPGFQIQHRFGGNRGYSLEASLETRYLLHEPTLAAQKVGTTSALGIFLVRNWRF